MPSKSAYQFIAVFFLILFIYCFIPIHSNYGYITYLSFIIPLFFVITQSYKAALVYGSNNPHYKALLVIFTGLIFVSIGETIIVIQQAFFDIDAFPTIADIFIIIGYPTILLGIIKEIINFKITIIPKKYLIIIAAVFLIAYYFIVKNYYNSDMNMTWNVVFILYRTVDFLMVIYTILAVRISYEFIKGKLFYPWLYIALGAFCAILAGIFVSIYYDEYKLGLLPYLLIDLLWVAGYLFSAYGFLCIRTNIKNIQNNLQKKINLSVYKSH